MPAIRLENVSKIYKGSGKSPKKEDIRRFETLSHVNLLIGQGEFVFFVGSRGAGSSTLLNLISGLLQPDGGAVYLDGANLAKLSRRQEKQLKYVFGRVPQESQLVRNATVFHNLCPPGRFGKMGGAITDGPLISKALALVGMAGCEERYPAEFTASECRRIELAKAIVYSPPILVLDKITDVMDDDSIWDVMHLLEEMNRRGTTVLMSTHAKQFVNIMRRRVVTLVDGKIVGDVAKGRFGDIV
ncbi:cell division ATP-binding protein FtsE [Acutalibacter caecimuris]|uniref:cell division ATP-binding protein FtsE n=1 Tax=Acutalibacter caecimuris TaxID=3093657 RepID=UPI002AC94294|nr:ATP-binding cassette domain-containing protein [Acutalibacter sp. M00118]